MTRVGQIHFRWVAFCVFCGFIATPARAKGISSIDFVYAQSKNAWETVDQINQAQGDLNKINEILRENYGTYEVAFAHASIHLSDLRTGIDSTVLHEFYFGTTSDVLALGVVQNPVIPELKIDAIATGEINGGFDGYFDFLHARVKTRVGGHLGMGYEKRIDAISTDLIQNIPTQSGSLRYFGPDLSVAANFPLTPSFKVRSDVAVSETSFRGTVDGTTESFIRWKLKNSLLEEVDQRVLGFDVVGIETILGPQPLPEEFLPRIWDYADTVNPWPELGAMAGAGVLCKCHWGRHSEIVARGGFYGGYPGGEISLQGGAITAALQTWGIEASSAYQTLGQRLYAATAALAL